MNREFSYQSGLNQEQSSLSTKKSPELTDSDDSRVKCFIFILKVDSEKMDEKALLDQLTFKMASNIINDLAKAAKVKDLKKVEAQKPGEC
jgi:hypothetical protein